MNDPINLSFKKISEMKFGLVQVLPRQTCGLYTHTIYIDKYPGGRESLEESIRGGELFQTIVFNRVS